MGMSNIGGMLPEEGSDGVRIVYADGLLMAFCPNTATGGDLLSKLVARYGEKSGEDRYLYRNENETCTLVERFTPGYEYPEPVIKKDLGKLGYNVEVLGTSPELEHNNPLQGMEVDLPDSPRMIILQGKDKK